MRRHAPLDEMLFPPFRGFPPEGIGFLRRLKRNNNRAWFQEHRREYEESVRFPMECLVAALGSAMREEAPEFDFTPKRSIFRIHRDTRFSNDKSPYKTNIAAAIELRGKAAKIERPGLYLSVEPGEVMVGGGLYMPAGEQLKAIRRAIAEDPRAYLAVVGAPRFRRAFGGIAGDTLQRAPLGWPADHPMIEHLRRKQFYVIRTLPEHACLRASFAGTAQRLLREALPLVRWLVAAGA